MQKMKMEIKDYLYGYIMDKEDIELEKLKVQNKVQITNS